MKILFTALGLMFLVNPTFAAKGRLLASGSDLDFSLRSGVEQGRVDEDAAAFYSAILSLEEMTDETEKNLEEFRLLAKYLEGRGFKRLAKKVKGRYFVFPKNLTLVRAPDKQVEAEDGNAAYTSLSFEFSYAESYIEKGTEVDGRPYPSLALKGTVFFRCEPDSKTQCPFAKISFREASIGWAEPIRGRGAQSSAGGVKP